MLKDLEYQFQEGETLREDIRIIGKSTCEHFQSALALLRIHKVGYYYLYIDTLPETAQKEIIGELRARYTGDLMCPFVIFNNNEFISGFQRDIWEARLF